jgi:hypothetical protein
MFPMLLTRQQLRYAAKVYCEVHEIPVSLYVQRVEWETINAGLVVLAN